MQDIITVEIADTKVKISKPPQKWIWLLRSPVHSSVNMMLWKCAALGICWRGANHPADPAQRSNDARNIMAYGERVLDALQARGATYAQVAAAGTLALMWVFGDELPDEEEVEETADFFGDGDEDSEK